MDINDVNIHAALSPRTPSQGHSTHVLTVKLHTGLCEVESSTASMAGQKTKGLAPNYSHQMVSCSSAPDESSFSCPYRPQKLDSFLLGLGNFC